MNIIKTTRKGLFREICESALVSCVAAATFIGSALPLPLLLSYAASKSIALGAPQSVVVTVFVVSLLIGFFSPIHRLYAALTNVVVDRLNRWLE